MLKKQLEWQLILIQSILVFECLMKIGNLNIQVNQVNYGIYLGTRTTRILSANRTVIHKGNNFDPNTISIMEKNKIY